MNKFLFLTTCVLGISCHGFAQETSTETCANGAGEVITGYITGTKYCISKTRIDWWNAHAWCDGLGMKLFDLNTDCQQFGTGCSSNQKCMELYDQNPELRKTYGDLRVWTANSDATSAYAVALNPATDSYWTACITKWEHKSPYVAVLCKPK